MSRFVNALPRRPVIVLAALAVGAGLFAGCASKPPPPPKPTVVNGSIQASAQLNPSVNKRPSPLQLRVYELKAQAAFGSADFMALYQGDQGALGAEMVAREEMTLQPGETRPYNKTLSPDTRFIGVVGIYRDLERANWRTVVAIQPNRTQTLAIRVGELGITATATVQP